jgi:hypothetical protein
MLILVVEASKKLSQSSGGTLRHNVSPLGSLEYEPSQVDLEYKPSRFGIQAKRLGLQAKRLGAQATALEMPWISRHNL